MPSQERQPGSCDISTQQISLQLIDAKAISQCRICLESEPADSQNSTLISPCACAGSLKHVHFQCLEAWVCKMLADCGHKMTRRGHMNCQVCRKKMHFTAAKRLALKSRGEICDGVRQNWRNFFILLLIMLLSLAFFSALLNYLLFIGFQALRDNNVVIVSLTIAGQTLFSIVFLVTAGIFLKRLFFKTHVRIDWISDDKLSIKD